MKTCDMKHATSTRASAHEQTGIGGDHVFYAAGVSTKIPSKSPFLDPICALPISGVEQQSKSLRKAEN
jgi:hypothetical protein